MKQMHIFLALFPVLFFFPPITIEDPPGHLTSEADQFDFWLGEWSLSWQDSRGNTIKGSNSVVRILTDHVIQESFVDSASGFSGMSLSVYDSLSGQWYQTWVDNQGGYLDFTGTFQRDRMILHRREVRQGRHFLQRMVWYNITGTTLDWSWERSDDEGKTWNTLWHISYQRKDPLPGGKKP